MTLNVRHRCPHHERALISLVHDLFEEKEDVEAAASAAPLATRIRPRSLEEFVGQEHILGPGKLLRRAIEADRLPSVIFSGPPGSGKSSAVIMPIAAISARPTNGWRGALSNFIYWAFRLSGLYKASRNRERQPSRP